MKKVYKLEDLDCANCAAKMECAIQKIDGVNSASVSFMAQRMTIDADDANFDEDCPYREFIKTLIAERNIKYIIDLHGLASWRDCDINLGINFGNNVKQNLVIYDKLYKSLKQHFNLAIDLPFKASSKTISGFFAENFGVWTIQIETNCRITNSRANIEKFNLLIKLITDWLNKIK